jgi:hypothetical protein
VATSPRVATSPQLQAIRTELSTYLVDQAYANVDVSRQLANVLPPRFKALAAPAAGSLRGPAQQGAEALLGRPRIQTAWEQANHVAAQQFINVSEGKPGAVTSKGNAVVLDLGSVLGQLVQRLGLPGALAQKIPPGAAQITVVKGNQVKSIENLANALRGLAIVLPVLSLGLFALAVGLARGRRRQTLMVVGIDLVLAGLAVLVLRRSGGHAVVDKLVTTDSVRPAGEAAWSIGTSMLRDVAQETIIAAIPLIVAAWLAGPSRAAFAFRRAVAPWLRERPDFTYGVVALLVLLIVLWGPIPATRKPIPVLITIGLVVLGVEALRRQTAAEFPDASVAAARASMHSRARRVRSGRRRPVPDGDGGNGIAATTLAPGEGRLDGLERLSALHDHGALTEEEFAAEKSALGSPP